MNIVVISVLNHIQTFAGCHNAVIAGGAARDEMFNVKPRDYDIWVPCKDNRDFHNSFQMFNLSNEFASLNPVITEKTVEYETMYHATELKFVYNMKLDGDINIDIIGFTGDDDEDYGTTVVQSFDYGLNMIYHDGKSVDDSNENFQNDFNRHRMTLVNLKSIQEMPKAVGRFLTIKERYLNFGVANLEFDSTILKLTRDKIKPKEKMYNTYISQSFDTLDQVINPVPARPWSTQTQAIHIDDIAPAIVWTNNT